MGSAYDTKVTDEKILEDPLSGIDYLGDPGVDGRIILNWIIKK
jgi:hypothetical protein